jgi:hypothetical protein
MVPIARSDPTDPIVGERTAAEELEEVDPPDDFGPPDEVLVEDESDPPVSVAPAVVRLAALAASLVELAAAASLANDSDAKLAELDAAALADAALDAILSLLIETIKLFASP